MSHPRVLPPAKYEWNLLPPAAPIFDAQYYPAFLSGASPDVLQSAMQTATKLLVGSPGFLSQSAAQRQTMYQDINMVLAPLVQSFSAKSTYLTEQTPYARYLADYEIYQKSLQKLKTDLHHKKVVERAIRKKYTLGIANADTPEMNKNASFRYSSSKSELLDNPEAHLAWHPRAKPEVKEPKHPELKEAKKELKSAKIKAKVIAIQAAAKAKPVVASTKVEIRAQQAELSKKQAELKVAFGEKVVANKVANVEAAAHGVSARQLATVEHKLESVQARRAAAFNKHGKPVAFPSPLEGGFLRSVQSGDSVNYHQLRFGTVTSISNIPEVKDEEGNVLHAGSSATVKLPVVNVVPARPAIASANIFEALHIDG